MLIIQLYSKRVTAVWLVKDDIPGEIRGWNEVNSDGRSSLRAFEELKIQR